MIRLFGSYLEKEFGLFSIIPLLILSDLMFGLMYLIVADGCTGTGSAYFSTMAICRVTLAFVGPEYLSTHLLAFVFWLTLGKTKYERVARAMILAYLFVLRPLLIFGMSRYQVIPFVPG